jgi:hypothetical protein
MFGPGSLEVTAHVLWVVGSENVPPTTAPVSQVVLCLLLVKGDTLGLVADDAVKAPGEQRHLFGQHPLQVPLLARG